MRWAGFLAMVALSSCTFSSEEAFFTDADAAFPIADGARFIWQAPEDAAQEVTFHRDGAAYEVTERNHSDEPMTGVLFIAVPETVEVDYIIQWQAEPGDSSRAYAFMWPDGSGFRVYSDPASFEVGDDAKPERAYCQRRAYGECMFATRQHLLALYQNVVYPTLAAGGGAEGYLQLTPIDDAALDRK